MQNLTHPETLSFAFSPHSILFPYSNDFYDIHLFDFLYTFITIVCILK